MSLWARNIIACAYRPVRLFGCATAASRGLNSGGIVQSQLCDSGEPIKEFEYECRNFGYIEYDPEVRDR